MARQIEELAVDVDRPIRTISRVVFWIFFILYAAILGFLGWFIYTHLLSSTTVLPGTEHQKDGVIVGLSVALLGVILASLTRDSIYNSIVRRVERKRKKS
jgi:hypothetical protein